VRTVETGLCTEENSRKQIGHSRISTLTVKNQHVNGSKTTRETISIPTNLACVAGAISREYFVSAAEHHDRSRERQSRARKTSLYSREFRKEVNGTRNATKKCFFFPTRILLSSSFIRETHPVSLKNWLPIILTIPVC